MLLYLGRRLLSGIFSILPFLEGWNFSTEILVFWAGRPCHVCRAPTALTAQELLISLLSHVLEYRTHVPTRLRLMVAIYHPYKVGTRNEAAIKTILPVNSPGASLSGANPQNGKRPQHRGKICCSRSVGRARQILRNSLPRNTNFSLRVTKFYSRNTTMYLNSFRFNGLNFPMIPDIGLSARAIGRTLPAQASPARSWANSLGRSPTPSTTRSGLKSAPRASASPGAPPATP
jgi:hypothetical protein